MVLTLALAWLLRDRVMEAIWLSRIDAPAQREEAASRLAEMGSLRNLASFIDREDASLPSAGDLTRPEADGACQVQSRLPQGSLTPPARAA